MSRAKTFPEVKLVDFPKRVDSFQKACVFRVDDH